MKEKAHNASTKMSVAASIQANIEPRRMAELKETLTRAQRPAPGTAAAQIERETSVQQTQEPPGHRMTQPCGQETTGCYENHEDLDGSDALHQHA